MNYKRILDIIILFCFILYPKYTSSGPYLDSAHGNSAYGVNRSATATIGYSPGNCAHCHEQHASINGAGVDPTGSPSKYAIFANNFTSQSDNFCFYCHKGSGSLQFSFDRTNYNYSYWFGGDYVNHLSPNNIYDAFNPASYGCCNASTHNLQDILNFVKQKWPETFKDESNPCNACHNPHLSQRGYPVVRPLPSQRNNIWGDDPGEKMKAYAEAHGGQYLAPYWYNSSSTYEPDGSTINDGSNVPDYVTFCTDCHNATDTISSSTSLTNGGDPSYCNCGPRNLNKFDWSTQSRATNSKGDYHGSIQRCADVDGKIGGQWRICGQYKENSFRGHPHSSDYYTDECETMSVGGLYQREPACAASTTDLDNDCNAQNGQIPDEIPDNIECGTCYCTSKTTGQKVDSPTWWGAIKPPYETANYINFILNCTDCHEPHGSSLPYLIRKTINGKYEQLPPDLPGPEPGWEQVFCATCHYHLDRTVTIYVPEFNLTLTPNGAHCGNMWNCINCHNHASVDRCYACTYCPTGGVHGHAF